MKSKTIIKQIAKENHTTPEKVETQIQDAIREAMKSNHPRARKLWKQIAPDGQVPSTERVISFCVDLVNKKKEEMSK